MAITYWNVRYAFYYAQAFCILIFYGGKNESCSSSSRSRGRRGGQEQGPEEAEERLHINRVWKIYTVTEPETETVAQTATAGGFNCGSSASARSEKKLMPKKLQYHLIVTQAEVRAKWVCQCVCECVCFSGANEGNCRQQPTDTLTDF